jgi:hypothetical protein
VPRARRTGRRGAVRRSEDGHEHALKAQLNVAVEGGSGRWHTCFTSLPSANYRIAVDQDPNHDAVFVETVTEYSAIGVP